MDTPLKRAARRVARGEPHPEEHPTELSAGTVRILELSDAFQGLVREERMRGIRELRAPTEGEDG